MKSQYKTEIFYNYIIIGILLILTLSFLLPFIVVLSTSLISEAEWAARGGHVLYPKKISFVAYDILFGKSYVLFNACLLYTSPSPRDQLTSRMPSSA